MLDVKENVPFYKEFLLYIERIPGNQWEDPFGAWSGLTDTMLDSPTPPIEFGER